MNKASSLALTALLLAPLAALPGLASAQPVDRLDQCNVVWATPSGNSFGSMPLGNGDVGANIWVEDNGDLLFYISKVNAFDAGHLLPKLGRIRLRLEPALGVNDFQQTLVLRAALWRPSPIAAGGAAAHLD